MNANHVMGNSWGPIEYRETGLYNFNTKFPSVDTVKSMSCFSDFNLGITVINIDVSSGECYL